MLIFLNWPLSFGRIFTHDCTHISAGHNIHRIPAVRLPAVAADHSPYQVLGQFQWGAHTIRNPPQPSVYVIEIFTITIIHCTLNIALSCTLQTASFSSRAFSLRSLWQNLPENATFLARYVVTILSM